MTEPKQLTETTWFDNQEGIVFVGVGQVSISFSIDEFWDFCQEIEDSKSALLKEDTVILGTYEKNGVIKKQLLLKPSSEDDYN